MEGEKPRLIFLATLRDAALKKGKFKEAAETIEKFRGEKPTGHKLKKLEKAQKINSQRRRILTAIGAVFIVPGVYLATKSSNPANVDIEKAPKIPAPKFRREAWKPTTLKPEGIELSDDEFTAIAEDFTTACTRYFSTEYLPRAEAEAKEEEFHSSEPLESLVDWSMTYLRQKSPQFELLLNRAQVEFTKFLETGKFSEIDALFEFLNSLLAPFDKFIRPVMKGYYVDLQDIDEKEYCSVAWEGTRVAVPVFYIGRGRLSGACNPPNDGNVRARFYHEYSPFIMVRKKHILAKDGMNGRNAHLYLYQNKADFPPDFDEEVIQDTVRHEATHALYTKLFPKATLRENAERKFLLKIQHPFLKGMITVDGEYTPPQAGELSAIGAAMAHHSYESGFKLFKDFRFEGDQFNAYVLSNYVLRQAIHIVTGIAYEKLEKIKKNDGPEAQTELLNICQNLPLTRPVINDIGSTMWLIGYNLFQQMEARA